jgi:O-succinylbenzoate synthase
MIEGLTFTPYRRAFCQPLRTARGIWAFREGFLVQYCAGRQRYLGEVAPLPAFGSESLQQAAEFLTEATKNGVDPLRLQSLPACAFALSAVKPQHAAETHYPVAGLLPAGAAALSILSSKIKEGFTRFKWKIGVEAVSDEIEHLLRMLAVSPDRVRFRLDANAALSCAELETWLQALSAHRHRIEFMEQPLAIGMEESMADAMQQFEIAIALDESLTYANYRDHIHTWVGPLVIKPVLMGAVSEQARELAPVASRVVLSSAFESRVAISKILALAQSLPQLTYALGFDTATAFEDSLAFKLDRASLVNQPLSAALARVIWDDFRV